MEALPSVSEIVPSERDDGRNFGQYLQDWRKNGFVREVVPDGDISISTYEDDELNGLSVVWSEGGFKAELYSKGQLMASLTDIEAWNEFASQNKMAASEFKNFIEQQEI